MCLRLLEFYIGGNMASNKKKEEKILDDVGRARMIKTIACDTGFRNAAELQKILHEKYGVEVHIDTIYTDLMRIELFEKEDLQAFENKIVADCNAHLNNLNHMSVHAKYEQYRIKAIDSYFKNVPEMLKVIRSCVRKTAIKSDKKEEVIEEKEKEGVEIQFGD